MAATAVTNWMMKGQIIIACNCDYGCPCNVNGRPSTGKCEGGWTWHIEQGKYGDVKLDGLNFGLYSNWPAAIHEGNGVGTCLIDQRADESQRAALATLVEGKGGGPWAIFRKTFRELHGPRYVRYEVDAKTNLPRVDADGLSVEYEYILLVAVAEQAGQRARLRGGCAVEVVTRIAFRVAIVLRESHRLKR